MQVQEGNGSGERTSAQVRVLRVDPRVQDESAYRTLREAVDAAQAGDTILLAPVIHDLQGRMLFLNKSVSIVGEGVVNTTSQAEIVGLPTSRDEASLIYVRNQEVDLHVSFSNLSIRASRLPDTINDRGVDCLRLQGGRRGVRTRVDISNVKLSQAGAGIGIEHYIFGDSPSDADFVVSVQDTLITDMFDDRDAQGNKENNTHSHGIYHDGGTLIMRNVTMRRIGWVPGSAIYTKSNKNQGLYGARGVRRVVGCTVENSSHCGFQYRAGTTYSEGNVSRLNPMGFQAGHRQTPGVAVVVSVGDVVADASDMADVNDGMPTITCGFHIDEAKYVSMNGFTAWNQTGRGGWAALHLSRVRNTIIDVREANISTWPGGGMATIEALDVGKHSFDRVTIKRNEGAPGIIAPDIEQTGLPLGGSWVDCQIVTIQRTQSAAID